MSPETLEINAAAVAGIKSVRAKPVVLKAAQITSANIDILSQWCCGKVYNVPDPREPELWELQVLEIPTPQGIAYGYLGQYLMCGTLNEFYPITAETYCRKYEDVVQDAR